MTIPIESPKGQGYIACMYGQSLMSNPHHGITAEIICQWYEWSEGWNQAYNENKFGVAQ